MGKGQKRTFEALLERVRLLLPLVRGWNPDCIVGVNAGGMLLASVLSGILEKEVRALGLSTEPPEVLWESVGDLSGKRVVAVVRSFASEKEREFLERFLKGRGALSVLTMVMVGKGGDYSCFPELDGDELFSWEEECDLINS
ncbi:hypothetical protein ACP6EK_03440 [Candidatus Caldatribacterium sp. SIUC1]|uniref:hypothetical protein n=1 Tax=Candidatus Caldatribacterium sp. SIUC1 TaxID=3418365 RepID=UPI003F690E13